MGILSAKEIFEFAIRIEENGEYFYRKMAEKFEEKDIKDLFKSLAEQELEHKKTFENMRNRLGEIKLSGSYPGEFYDYMGYYVKDVIFPIDTVDEEVKKVSSLDEALGYAIRREMDSILYYKEIMELVQDSERSLINDIVNEERRHFVKLAELKYGR